MLVTSLRLVDKHNLYSFSKGQIEPQPLQHQRHEDPHKIIQQFLLITAVQEDDYQVCKRSLRFCLL